MISESTFATVFGAAVAGVKLRSVTSLLQPKEGHIRHWPLSGEVAPTPAAFIPMSAVTQTTTNHLNHGSCA